MPEKLRGPDPQWEHSLYGLGQVTYPSWASDISSIKWDYYPRLAPWGVTVRIQSNNLWKDPNHKPLYKKKVFELQKKKKKNLRFEPGSKTLFFPSTSPFRHQVSSSFWKPGHTDQAIPPLVLAMWWDEQRMDKESGVLSRVDCVSSNKTFQPLPCRPSGTTEENWMEAFGKQHRKQIWDFTGHTGYGPP